MGTDVKSLSGLIKMKFSRHARRQMKWSLNSFKMIQGRLLKITYKSEDNEIIVITAMVKGV